MEAFEAAGVLGMSRVETATGRRIRSSIHGDARHQGERQREKSLPIMRRAAIKADKKSNVTIFWINLNISIQKSS